MTIEVVNSDDWKKLSENAHVAVFDKRKPSGIERIDYALLFVDSGNVPAAYITCKELDSESLYWQYGGVFQAFRHSITAFRILEQATEWSRERYKNVGFRVENDNLSMLKCAMKVGYRIIGVRIFEGTILLEHQYKGDSDG